MKTKVINLISGPGSGKSTTAAQLFAEMKYNSIDCELVREYVKDWAYIGLKPDNIFDQIHITNEQLRKESIYYNKIEYLVTDSPIFFGIVYDFIYTKKHNIKDIVLNYLKLAEEKDVEHIYYFIKRNKKYISKGRYQSEKEANDIDKIMINMMNECNIQYKIIDTDPRNVSKEILKDINIW